MNIHYEVYLVDRSTGNKVKTIFYSSRCDDAVNEAWSYNIKHFGREIMDDVVCCSDLLFKFSKVKPEEKYYAVFIKVEEKERKDMENKNANKETVTIDMYADSTGLYTEAECNEDNTASFDVPVEIVREYFYKELKDYYPDKTYEEWITEEYTMDDFEHGFIDLAEKRGYEFKRSDGIDLNNIIEQFKERFRREVADYIEIIPGSWDVYLNKDDQHYSTQGDVHLGDTWEDFLEWLVEDIKEMGDLNIFTFDFRPVWVGDDEYLEKEIEDELAEKLNDKISESSNESYAGYIACNMMESAEIARNNGNLYDLDRMVHLSEILGFKVSYGFYHYVECKLTDGCSMDLDEMDKLKLMNWLYEYANGKEC